MRQLHQSDLVLCLDTTSLAPRGNALLLGTDRGDVGDGGTVAKGRCGRLLKIISDTVDIHMKRKGGGRGNIPYCDELRRKIVDKHDLTEC